MMRRALAVAFAGLALAACSASGTAKAPGGAPFTLSGSPVATKSVDLPKSYRFSPAIARVAAGDTVTWTNHDNFIHSVKFVSGSSFYSNLPISGAASTSFPVAGTYYYECSYHPSQMKGEVIVV
jgi:plastocyanin